MAMFAQTSDDRLPAYQRLRDDIARRVAAGEWGPDVALPSDNRLAAEHSLSVGTVRKALQILTEEGLLERRQGSGTFLRKPAFDATLFRFFQVREHGTKASMPSSRLISRRITAAPAQVKQALGTDRVIRIDRLRFLSEQPLLSEEIYIDADRFAGFETLADDEIGPLLYPVYYDRFGVFVARAEDEVSFSAATPTIAERLEIAPGAPIATIERTAFSMTGEAVEWRIASGPAERFRYRSRIG